MAIEYFCCYHSYMKKCEKLTDQELGRLFRALMKYSESGERPELAGRESIAFDFIADDIDRSRSSYEEICKKNMENGKLGGRPKNRKNRTVLEETQKSQYKYEDEYEYKSKSKREYKNESVSPPKSPSRGTRFTPPAVEEVAAYCQERKNGIDAQHFVDYYARQKWKLSNGNAMADWKASIRTWESRDRARGKQTGPRDYGDPEDFYK